MSSGDGPGVYFGPDREQHGTEHEDTFVRAIEEGGGVLVTAPEEAEAIVWLGAERSRLPEMLGDNIRWVQLPSAGIEPWVEDGLIDRRRLFTSAVGAYAEPVAEHALALMLAGARRLHECARAETWNVDWGHTLRGAKVVILGAGGIGRVLIEMLGPLGARIIAVNRSGPEVAGAERSYPADDISELWSEGDFFVVAAPATSETQHMIGRRELSLMKPGAWIVNVARGSLIDTDALVEALAAGSIGGAALDVTDPEPLPAGHPLWQEPGALITPHAANPPAALAAGLAQRIRENVARFGRDEELIGTVDPEAGY